MVPWPNPLNADAKNLQPLYDRVNAAVRKVILPTAAGVSNEGRSSELLVPVPAVSWPWVQAWGSLEPSWRGGENAQKTGKNGEKMGEIRPKKCEQGKDRTDHLASLLAPACAAGVQD